MTDIKEYYPKNFFERTISFQICSTIILIINSLFLCFVLILSYMAIIDGLYWIVIIFGTAPILILTIVNCFFIQAINDRRVIKIDFENERIFVKNRMYYSDIDCSFDDAHIELSIQTILNKSPRLTISIVDTSKNKIFYTFGTNSKFYKDEKNLIYSIISIDKTVYSKVNTSVGIDAKGSVLDFITNM